MGIGQAGADRLIRLLSERQPHPLTYLLTGNLTSALQMSLVPNAAISRNIRKWFLGGCATAET
jgi:hypothetical protein